jgi:hypothetical protein
LSRSSRSQWHFDFTLWTAQDVRNAGLGVSLKLGVVSYAVTLSATYVFLQDSLRPLQ